MESSILRDYWLPLLLTGCITSTICAFFNLFLKNPRPSNLPWSPSGKRGMLASLGAAFEGLRDMRGSLLNGQKIAAEGSGFLLPSLLEGVIVCLPLKCYKWWASQPASALSWHDSIKKIFHFKYTLGVSNVEYDFDVVRYEDKILRRYALANVPAAYNELKFALSERDYALPGQEWRSICLYEELVRLISPAANIMLTGPALCRDQAYLQTMSAYIVTLVPCSLLIHCFPSPLQPLVGKLVQWFRYIMFEKELIAKVRPVIENRLSMWREKDSVDGDTFLDGWLNNASTLQSRSKTIMNVDLILGALTGVNFAGLHTSSTISAAAWYYILTYQNCGSLIGELRDEIETVAKRMDGGWTSAKLDELLLLDSVIRETLRLQPSNDASTSRVALKELTTPDGLTISPGMVVVVPAININMDPVWYPHPAVWDPYRHLGKRAGTAAESATATSEHFVSFGHAYHACPGRWFAVAVTKMVFVEMLTNFDIEPLRALPKPLYIGTMRAPSPTQTVKIRHRSEGNC